MCLDKITNSSPAYSAGFGFKVFEYKLDTGKIVGPIVQNPVNMTPAMNTSVKIHVEFAEQKSNETLDAYYFVMKKDSYYTGFHLFETWEDAKEYKKSLDKHLAQDYFISKVYFESPICEGVQDGRKVIVAERMKICV